MKNLTIQKKNINFFMFIKTGNVNYTLCLYIYLTTKKKEIKL